MPMPTMHMPAAPMPTPTAQPTTRRPQPHDSHSSSHSLESLLGPRAFDAYNEGICTSLARTPVGLLRVWLPTAVLGPRESSVPRDCTHSVLAGSTYAFWNQLLMHAVWRREARARARDPPTATATAPAATTSTTATAPTATMRGPPTTAPATAPATTTTRGPPTNAPAVTNRMASWRELQAMITGVPGERREEGTWSGICRQPLASTRGIITHNRRRYLPAPKLCRVADSPADS